MELPMEILYHIIIEQVEDIATLKNILYIKEFHNLPITCHQCREKVALRYCHINILKGITPGKYTLGEKTRYFFCNLCYRDMTTNMCPDGLCRCNLHNKGKQDYVKKLLSSN